MRSALLAAAVILTTAAPAAAGPSLKLLSAGTGPRKPVRYAYQTGTTDRALMTMAMSMSNQLPGQPAMGAVPLPAKAVRAPDGRRIGIALTDAEATLTLTDDLAALEAALAGRGLAAGPFPREQVLALLADVLGGTDG